MFDKITLFSASGSEAQSGLCCVEQAPKTPPLPEQISGKKKKKPVCPVLRLNAGYFSSGNDVVLKVVLKIKN